MQHVVQQPVAPFPIAGGALWVHQVTAWQDNLIWILVCAQTGEVAAVDGPEAKGVQAWCAANGRPLTTILNTHVHPDHIGINRALHKSGDLEGMRVVGSKTRAADVPGITERVGEGDRVRVGAVEARVWLTEGHQDGHITYVFDGAAFCGDVLFGAGCGYLFDGPPAKMHASLQRLATLPDDTLVCCAHEYTEDNLRFAWSVEPDNAALADRIRRVWAIRAGGGCSVPSSIAEERATNPFLRVDSPSVRAAVAAAFPARDLSTGAQIFAATRALKDTKAYKQRSDSLPIEG